jgi:mutator protein MutT
LGENSNGAGPKVPKVVRTFDTGANRDVDAGKYDYEGFLSPLVLERYAQYMHKNRHLRDGSVRDSDNWQKGIPLPVYMKSGWRHFMEWWSLHRRVTGREEMVEALCALMFNVMGYLHELLKIRNETTVVRPKLDLSTPAKGDPIHVVAAVRYNSITDRYWVARRATDGDNQGTAGMWEFPGGKIEPGETEQEALTREMREEFQVEAVVRHKIDSILAEGWGKRYMVHFYSVAFARPETLTVHSGASWCTLEELQQQKHLPSGTEFIRRLAEARRYCSIVVGPRMGPSPSPGIDLSQLPALLDKTSALGSEVRVRMELAPTHDKNASPNS